LGDAIHGHGVEYCYEAFCIVLAVWQLAVCPGFYTDATPKEYEWACWGFAMPCGLTALLSLYTVFEVHQNNKTDNRPPGVGFGMASWRREYIECFLYFAGSAAFAIASVFYMPDIYTEWDDAITNGTTLYLTGSVCLALGAYINATGLAGSAASDQQLKLALLMLLFANIGSISFVAGSWLYFPQFTDGTCSVEPTWQPVDRGTDLYMMGCACFVMQALVGFIKMHLNNVHSFIDQETDLAERGDKWFIGQPGVKSSAAASDSAAGGMAASDSVADAAAGGKPTTSTNE